MATDFMFQYDDSDPHNRGVMAQGLIVNSLLPAMIFVAFIFALIEYRGEVDPTVLTHIFYLFFLSGFLFIICGCLILLPSAISEWVVLSKATNRRFLIEDTQVLLEIERLLDNHQVEFHLLGPNGKLPDRFLPRFFRYIHEIAYIPKDEMRIIVTRSYGSPDERFTDVFFPPEVRLRKNSDNIYSEIVTSLKAIESRTVEFVDDLSAG